MTTVFKIVYDKHLTDALNTHKEVEIIYIK